MGILTWILFGLLVGIVANVLDPRPARGGIIGAIALGILGSLVGGFLGNLLFGLEITGITLSSVILAVTGALLLMFIARAVYNRSF
jgi:uncharacterized membrane protein YeaQ/YmgE (transglycosylase-associated protein family)